MLQLECVHTIAAQRKIVSQVLAWWRTISKVGFSRVQISCLPNPPVALSADTKIGNVSCQWLHNSRSL